MAISFVDNSDPAWAIETLAARYTYHTPMKAIVYSGDVLKVEELEKPLPANDEVLIRVRAASVNPMDYHLLRHPFLRRVRARAGKGSNRPLIHRLHNCSVESV
jgi:hypothetical protein